MALAEDEADVCDAAVTLFVHAGTLFVHAGTLFVHAGTLFVHAGTLFVHAGTLFVHAGTLFVHAGTLFVHAGTLFVHAGIAASDAICSARLGEFAQGENQHQAVSPLEQADRDAGKHRSTLLSLKTKAAYSHLRPTKDERAKAARAAGALLETARGLGRSGSRVQ